MVNELSMVYRIAETLVRIPYSDIKVAIQPIDGQSPIAQRIIK